MKQTAHENRNPMAGYRLAKLKRGAQKGAVMIVALLLLLVMTILAISGVGNSTLEQKMSGNFYNSASAFQASEQGLRVAEQWVMDVLFYDSAWKDKFESATANGLYTAKNPAISNTNEVCRGDPGCYFDPTDENEWCSGGAGCNLPKGFVTLGDNLEGTALSTVDMNVERQPQFIIEYIGSVINEQLMMGEDPLPEKEAFRITVIGWSVDGKKTHILQGHVQLPLYVL